MVGWIKDVSLILFNFRAHFNPLIAISLMIKLGALEEWNPKWQPVQAGTILSSSNLKAEDDDFGNKW